MEYVEAIREKEKIRKIKNLLLEQSKRDYLLFVLGINTGIRVSELLAIKVKDVLDPINGIKDFYEHENTSVYLNDRVKSALKMYFTHYKLEEDDYLFKSKKGCKPITRQQAYRIINKSAKEAGVKGNIGTHTMRKTFGYHAYKKGVAISILQRMYKHSNASQTYQYLGIDKEEDNKVRVDVNL